jgi:Uma2 family endonuclease
MPDDGRRYELIDGLLVVSPAPRWRHQHAQGELHFILRSVCPREFTVFTPIDVRGGPRTSVQPDLSVVRDADLVSEKFLSVPVLAVEILSPSTAAVDRLLKRDVYADLGVASYWMVDLDDPSVTVLALARDGYAEQACIRGDETLAVTEPFPAAFHLIDLLHP